jgi:hypothetical protein
VSSVAIAFVSLESIVRLRDGIEMADQQNFLPVFSMPVTEPNNRINAAAKQDG